MAKLTPTADPATVLDARFGALARTGLDAGTLRTWDERLLRRTRILVPIDVQAYVVRPGGGEPTLPLTGGAGDPPPFTPGTPRAPGVHLHWAMPDALLGAAPIRDRATALTLPALPDRWVVIRTVAPVGAAQVRVRGWVIDARTGSVTPLESYAGTPAPAPAGVTVLDPLDAAAGGSLLWTASYTASAGRLGLHDPLTDLAGGGRRPFADQAVYTVAGWWSEPAQDPLVDTVGPVALQGRLGQLRWRLSPDLTGDGQPSTYATLLHGAVLGVPVGGALPSADDRPNPHTLSVAAGQDIDDVVAALGAQVLRLGPDQRRSAETLVAALASGLIDSIGAPDGLADLAEREHSDGFWALPGTPLAGSRPDVLRAEGSASVDPHLVGRKGRAAGTAPGARLAWADGWVSDGSAASAPTADGEPASSAGSVPPREVVRAAPRFFRPAPPVVALRGARPNHRHHGDGLFDDTGRLLCRYPHQCATELTGVVNAATVLPSLGSGAVPEEVLLVVREAVLLNPYGYRWLAAAIAPTKRLVEKYARRLAAELVRLYGIDGSYDGTSQLTARIRSWADVSAQRSISDGRLAAEVARHSLLVGTPPSPLALTTWRQPWVPLWLEWRVSLDGNDSIAGWELADLDLQPAAAPPTTTAAPAGRPVTVTLAGRSPVGTSVCLALQEAIRRWLHAEQRRAATDGGGLSTADRDLLDDLADLLDAPGSLIGALDVVSASLDGIREQLLGIDYIGVLARGPESRPAATGAPVPLFGGSLRVDALRLVDAFGRLLELPAAVIAALTTTVELEVPGPAGSPRLPGLRMKPRIQHLARWLLRLVDPAAPADADPSSLPEAYVDQLNPAAAVNPVAGFLLPDHIDEELEVFTVAGTPVGALGHDAISGAVTWEPAPGRPLPPDAQPGDGLNPHAWIAGAIAAGLVRADAQTRGAQHPPDLSALSALLRAIDTTLWTVDTFAAVGSPTVAGLVGRPVALVRATLRLDVPDDTGEVEVRAPGGVEARRAAFAALAEQHFPVRLGTLTRSDDALLGFYVDDDYSRLYLVDRVVAAHAVDSGRHRGHLGLLGAVLRPGAGRLAHPYLVIDPTLWLRPGQTLRLTLLMLPIGQVHLTSGILPRKQLALADDWVTAGLRRLVPSVRVGPVLVDPAEIRLPLVHLLGEQQTFTRRAGPLTWRDDPILAATQTAYLPRLPHEVQEGWVRVTPDEPSSPPGGAP